MLFTYKAIDSSGKNIEKNIEADTLEKATITLQEMKYVIIYIKKANPINIDVSFLGLEKLFSKGPKIKDLVIFSRQVSTLFSSGVSALKVFRLVEEEIENREFKTIVQDIGNQIQGGVSISDAFGKYDETFTPFYSNMIRSGEESGKLDEVFSYLASYLDRKYALEQKIKKATTYPKFVIIAFIGIMFLMSAIVIPKLGALLTEQGASLPLFTKIILNISNFSRKYWYIIILVVMGISVYVKNLSRSETGKETLDYLKLKIPILRNLYTKIFISRLTDNLDVMLTSGVPIVRSLEITSNVIDNSVFRSILQRVTKKVKSGRSLSQSFYEEGSVLPIVLTQMTKVGEETGKLGYILKNLSGYYKNEVETTIDNTIALIEPTLIICLAAGVGVLIGAILVPMYSVISNV